MERKARTGSRLVPITLVAVLLAAACSSGGGRSSSSASSAAAPSTTTSAPVTTTTSTTSTTSTTTTAPLPPTTALPPPSGGSAVVVRRGNPDRAVVALTFDAGSDTGYAAEILDTLARNHVTATFGMTGQWADANPDLVRRMAAEGHQLVNHTYDHRSFTGRSTGAGALSPSQRLDELARAEAAIRAASGVSTLPWFRPPYGDEDGSVRADVASAGYGYELMWTVDSLGWQGKPADQVVQRCLDGAVPGAIFLFHVGSGSTDHDALQRTIDGLRAAGYGFVTATGLLTG